MTKKWLTSGIILTLLLFSSQSKKEEVKENIVTVKEIRGAKDVLYKKDEKGAQWQKLEKIGTVIEKNTIISTGKDSEVILNFEKGEFIIKQLTLVKVVSLTEIKEIGKETPATQTNVQLKIGKINLKLKKEEKLDGKININTPTETASITGTDIDFNVTPYGSEINCKETARKVEVLTAGLSLNIITGEKVVTSKRVEEIKVPAQVIQEKAEKKDVQINLTKEEKNFQVTINVNLETVKPIHQAANNELPKRVILNTLIKNIDELPRQLIADTIVNNIPVEVIKERINEIPENIVQTIESTLTTALTPTTTTTALTPTTTTTALTATTTTTALTQTTTTTHTAVACPNQNCF